ncbi:hypothetical protein F5Y15DRAFT_321993 [Xylariaceae sp. FL0016]|nr:hypothetical protein F5Y15DRAFT_321993 [Xylariaceae sp. FL0016]
MPCSRLCVLIWRPFCTNRSPYYDLLVPMAKNRSRVFCSYSLAYAPYSQMEITECRGSCAERTHAQQARDRRHMVLHHRGSMSVSPTLTHARKSYQVEIAPGHSLAVNRRGVPCCTELPRYSKQHPFYKQEGVSTEPAWNRGYFGYEARSSASCLTTCCRFTVLPPFPGLMASRPPLSCCIIRASNQDVGSTMHSTSKSNAYGHIILDMTRGSFDEFTRPLSATYLCDRAAKRAQ